MVCCASLFGQVGCNMAHYRFADEKAIKPPIFNGGKIGRISECERYCLFWRF
jgi:hypothetical protein